MLQARLGQRVVGGPWRNPFVAVAFSRCGALGIDKPCQKRTGGVHLKPLVFGASSSMLGAGSARTVHSPAGVVRDIVRCAEACAKYEGPVGSIAFWHASRGHRGRELAMRHHRINERKLRQTLVKVACVSKDILANVASIRSRPRPPGSWC